MQESSASLHECSYNFIACLALCLQLVKVSSSEMLICCASVFKTAVVPVDFCNAVPIFICCLTNSAGNENLKRCVVVA